MCNRLILWCAYFRSPTPTVQWRSTGFTRYLSSISHHDERVSIPVGGNGTVNLIISKPTQPTTNNNVLVYLPPGLLLTSSPSQNPAITSKTLKSAFPTTTIVDVQYRISLLDIPVPSQHHRDTTKPNDTSTTDHRFPTPIHDVYAAWDYITDHLELYNHDVIDGKEIYHRLRVCLVGSHVGGALALSLALTDPSSILAVAVLDGLVDWVGLDELVAGDFRANSAGEKEGFTGSGTGTRTGTEAAQKEKRRNRAVERENLRRAARELMRVRRRLFRSHSGYFDAFASPVLFLRAPGRDTPFEPMGDVRVGGNGNSEVTVVESDGGSVGGEAFGPYDDDWQSHVPGESGHGTETNAVNIEGTVNGHENDNKTSGVSDKASIATGETSSVISELSDIGPATPSTSTLSATVTPQPLPSSTEQPPTPPRRRKVLRRWPPTGHPNDDILLPHINIFTTPASTSTRTLPLTYPKSHEDSQTITDISPVLNLQATELQDLLRKACFWGRERSVAEERVSLTRVEGYVSESGTDRSDEQEVFEWLRRRFEGS